MHASRRLYTAVAVTAVFAAGAIGTATIASAGASTGSARQDSGTATPIKHLVVIFDENVSFDHYFGTYPYAANLPGENRFHRHGNTPDVNGLYTSATGGVPAGPLLTSNPNLSNPQRLLPADPMTCDQDHGYTHEQSAADNGKMDKFVQNTGRSATIAQCLNGLTDNGAPEPVPAGSAPNYAVMDYYDGNTVTGIWNYAQHFAMSDNAYVTTYGPSTPGAFNVTAAQTYGTICGPAFAAFSSVPCQAPAGLNAEDVTSSNITTSANGPTPVGQQPAAGTGTTYSDADPTYDICTYLPRSDGGDGGTPAGTITMGGNNIGEELSTAGVTWGWFQGGFDDGYVPGQGTQPTTAQICSAAHKNAGGNTITDYSPHHEPFQYWASTANPMHLPPTSVAMVGHSDQANHQYDLADFFAAADAGNLPAVSYLKAPAYQDAHAGYSDPADEQQWLVSTVNHLEQLPSWKSTAVVITYDDSDGWYDHVFSPVQTGSQTSLDTLNGAGQCGTAGQVPVNSAGQPEQARCGLGVRLPFLVISRYAKGDFVDHTAISQASVVKFIEENWGVPALGNGAVDTSSGSIDSMLSFDWPLNFALFLNPATGEPGNSGLGG